MNDDLVYRSLVDIVGEDYASNRPEELFIYSTDSGTEGPRKVDYVAMPQTVDHVQRIVALANQSRVPITPMGANLTLNGLGLPFNGGIVLDMKRMDRILELNRYGRYVVVEAGVTQGKLGPYLEMNCPDLEHSRPEAPPMATVVGNIVIRGHGYLSLRNGNNAHQINGMEVVLPTGELCQIGAGSVSPWPFCKGPLPDLTGLICGWNGTTGIITKLSLKLFPRRRILDVLCITTADVEVIPRLLYSITHVDMADNVFVIGSAWADSRAPTQFITISITGDAEEEIEYKRSTFRRVVREFGEDQGARFIERVPDFLKTRFVEKPPFVSPALAADSDRGGGFRYCGAILPPSLIPVAWKKGAEIAGRYHKSYSHGIQVLGYCHSVMFGFVYTFNRASPSSVEDTIAAMKETNAMVLDIGGIPWKAEASAQEQIVNRMDVNTFALIGRIKRALDPNGIMNPGNWSR